MKCLILLCVFLGLMSVAYGRLGGVSNDVSCSDALTTLLPCFPFLTGIVQSPSGPCCIAVSTLNGEADTTGARRSVCQCLKENAPRFGVITEKAKLIPVLCNVDLPAPIDPNIDCSKIQ